MHRIFLVFLWVVLVSADRDVQWPLATEVGRADQLGEDAEAWMQEQVHLQVSLHEWILQTGNPALGWLLERFRQRLWDSGLRAPLTNETWSGAPHREANYTVILSDDPCGLMRWTCDTCDSWVCTYQCGVVPVFLPPRCPDVPATGWLARDPKPCHKCTATRRVTILFK
jgi:hypothetical protein